MTKYAIVVDPYGAAAEYGPAFRARQVSPVAVLSTPEPLPAFVAGWHPEQFDVVHRHTGTVAELASTLAAYHPSCVLAGIESGVELAEELCEILSPGTGNEPGTTAARRHKAHMGRAVARAGLPALRQIHTGDPDEVAAWIRAEGLQRSKLVLKPPKSGGTDGVHVTEAGEDWQPYFDQLNGTVNRFDIRNEGVLVQEYAAGPEYMVDGYSVDGRYGVVDVFRYTKHTRAERLGVYDAATFVPPEDPVVAALVPYTRRVTGAVGIRNGPSHAEVKLTPEGPRLIEVAARLAGAGMQIAARWATDDSQVDRTVRHRVDGAFTPGYSLVRHTSSVWICAHRAGTLRGEELARIQELGSVRAVGMSYAGGDHVPATVDLFTSIGWVILADEEESAVQADYARIKELESLLTEEERWP